MFFSTIIELRNSLELCGCLGNLKQRQTKNNDKNKQTKNKKRREQKHTNKQIYN